VVESAALEHGEVDRADASFGSFFGLDEAAALRAELQKTADETTALRAELQKANEEVELLKQTAVQRASSIAELTENIRTLEAAAGREIEQLEADRERARNELAAVLNSTSWRITAPLRAIVRFTRAKSSDYRPFRS
jgi:predicted  nucleic acid-binding Zn-ribbon protein